MNWQLAVSEVGFYGDDRGVRDGVGVLDGVAVGVGEAYVIEWMVNSEKLMFIPSGLVEFTNTPRLPFLKSGSNSG